MDNNITCLNFNILNDKHFVIELNNGKIYDLTINLSDGRLYIANEFNQSLISIPTICLVEDLIRLCYDDKSEKICLQVKYVTGKDDVVAIGMGQFLEMLHEASKFMKKHHCHHDDAIIDLCNYVTLKKFCDEKTERIFTDNTLQDSIDLINNVKIKNLNKEIENLVVNVSESVEAVNAFENVINEISTVVSGNTTHIEELHEKFEDVETSINENRKNIAGLNDFSKELQNSLNDFDTQFDDFKTSYEDDKNTFVTYSAATDLFVYKNDAVTRDELVIEPNVKNASINLTKSESNHAYGAKSVTAGDNAVANGSYSCAIGYGVTVENPTEVAFGKYNVTYRNPSNAFDGKEIARVFSLGNGLNSSNRHNIIDARQDGSIYISNINGEGEYYQKPMICLQDELNTLLNEINILKEEIETLKKNNNAEGE